MVNAESVVTQTESIIFIAIRDYWHVLMGFGGTLWALFELRTQQKQNQRDIISNKEALTKHCEKTEESIEDMKSQVGLRITEVERNQDKMMELIYKEQRTQSNEIAQVLSLVQDVRASVNKTEGYLQAQKEFNVRHEKN